MSNELLRVIQDTNRSNHLRRRNSAFSSEGRVARPVMDSQQMLDDLECRLSAEIRYRVDRAMEQVADRARSAAPAPQSSQEPMLKTEEIVYHDHAPGIDNLEEQLRDHLDAMGRSTQRALRDGLASVERSIEERLSHGHADAAPSDERILEKLATLEEKLAVPLVLDHEGESAPEHVLELLQRMEEQLVAIAKDAESPVVVDMTSVDLSGVQERLIAELSSVQPLSEESLNEALQALGGVAELREAQDAASQQLTELKRDFSHLVLTLNSHLEESRDKTQHLVEEFGKHLVDEFQLDKLKNFMAGAGAGGSEASADVLAVLEKLNRLDERLAALPELGENAVLEEIREVARNLAEQGNADEMMAQLRRDFAHLVNTLSSQLETRDPAPQVDTILEKIDGLAQEIAEMGPSEKTKPGRQQDVTELVSQLRRDFSLLVKAFNSHLEETRAAQK